MHKSPVAQSDGQNALSARGLLGRKVYLRNSKKGREPQVKKVGKLHSFLIHPRKAKLVGFLIKRPDMAWMFHRSDVFVSADGFEISDGEVFLLEDGGRYGTEAEKRLRRQEDTGIDECILWMGLPVLTEGGRQLGILKDVIFETDDGRVIEITVGNGATADALLGDRRIPADMIRGFRRGKGTLLSDSRQEDADDDELHGAIVVSKEANGIRTLGGVAEKAGAATAIATAKTKKVYRKAVDQTADARRVVGDKMKKVGDSAADAAQKGAFVTGRQIARAQGMFSDFKEEFMRAMKDDEDD